MKLLLVILGIIVAVNANTNVTLPYANLTTDDFKRFCQNNLDIVDNTIELVKNMQNTTRDLLVVQLKSILRYAQFQKIYVKRMILKIFDTSGADIRTKIMNEFTDDEIYFKIVQEVMPYDSLTETDLATLDGDVVKYLKAVKEGTNIPEETKIIVLKKLKQMPEIIERQEQYVDDAINKTISTGSKQIQKKISKYFHSKGNDIYMKMLERQLKNFHDAFQKPLWDADINVCMSGPDNCLIVGDPQVENIYKFYNFINEIESQGTKPKLYPPKVECSPNCTITIFQNN